MARVRIVRFIVTSLILALSQGRALASPWPSTYPGAYASIVDEASREGSLTIWSVTDSRQVTALLAGFRQLYPRIAVHYVELPAKELYSNFLAEEQAGRGTSDFLWSSAMDLQIKLVNDGYSQPYASPERASLPPWAVWKNEAWGITAEPIVFVYNRRLLRAFPKVPGTHPDLVRFLKRNGTALHGKVATYDPTVSAVGYLYLSQDSQANLNTWDLVSALGRAGVKLFATTGEILTRLADRRLAFAYDMVGSYALEAQAHNPDIGVIVPRDYALVMSRIAVIPKAARHPNAARLFLDYLLSRSGQAHLADQYMIPVRTNFPLSPGLRIIEGSERAIRVGPALLVHQDQLTRRKFLRDWARALANRPSPASGASPLAHGKHVATRAGGPRAGG